MSQHTTVLTDDNFHTATREGVAVVDFWAPWCGPCRTLGPIVDQLAHDYAGRAMIAKLNIDDNAVVAQSHNIRTIPTILFFKEGKEVHKLVGAKPKHEIQAIIDRLLDDTAT